MTVKPPLKPMAFGLSLLYFGLPALVFVIGFHVVMPWLIDQGVLPYYAYLIALGVPLAFMLLASLLWLRLEGRSLDWATLRERFRLRSMTRQAWGWSALALLLGSVVGFGLMMVVSNFLIQRGIIPIPSDLPAFISPLSMTDPGVYDEAVGGVHSNWLLLAAMLIVFFFNILGEEFWWRGVVLPRQELAFGQQTWIVHGTMWAFFHVFKWWDVLNLLPICLAIAFVCSRQRSATPGIVIHGVTNGVAFIPLVLGILGLVRG